MNSKKKPARPASYRLTLDEAVLQRALILMAKPDYVRHFADFISENDDANTADLFMQFAVYGEEVFA